MSLALRQSAVKRASTAASGSAKTWSAVLRCASFSRREFSSPLSLLLSFSFLIGSYTNYSNTSSSSSSSIYQHPSLYSFILLKLLILQAPSSCHPCHFTLIEHPMSTLGQLVLLWYSFVIHQLHIMLPSIHPHVIYTLTFLKTSRNSTLH